MWSFALRFEVPSAVGFRFDLADDPAFEHAPHGPVHVVSGDGVEMRSLSLGTDGSSVTMGRRTSSSTV